MKSLFKNVTALSGATAQRIAKHHHDDNVSQAASVLSSLQPLSKKWT